jgi:hypothetical protein
MSKLIAKIAIAPDDIYKKIDITDDQATSLEIALSGRPGGDNLQTRFIEDALDSGIFSAL